MERTTNLSIFSHTFLIFEPCTTSENNLITHIENSEVVTTLHF